jgi:SAM-dependent methyltransferase
VDPVLDVDWASHWSGLVEARAVRRGGSEHEAFWDHRAQRFQRSVRRQPDPFWQFLEPWLLPTQTVIDVGAGVGRHSVPIANRVDWVTAVEPSQGMRERIPALENVTVIASRWEDADPAPADLVICVHVLYDVADPVPFVEKLQRCARERVFIVLRDAGKFHPADWIASADRPRAPAFRDCFMLLRQMGVAPDAAMFEYRASFWYESLDEAVAECRAVLGQDWEETHGRAWLEAHLQRQEDGTLLYEVGMVTAGVLHWKPGS